MIKTWSLTLAIRFCQMFAQVTTKRPFPEKKHADKQKIVYSMYSLHVNGQFNWTIKLIIRFNWTVFPRNTGWVKKLLWKYLKHFPPKMTRIEFFFFGGRLRSEVGLLSNRFFLSLKLVQFVLNWLARLLTSVGPLIWLGKNNRKMFGLMCK